MIANDPEPIIYDYYAKLILIGDSGVGKTCLLIRYCDNNFRFAYVTSIGVDTRTKIIEFGNKKLRLLIMDTAGQEKFRNITANYYKGSNGVMLCYACDDRESFNNIKNWIKSINDNGEKDLPKILVATKKDLECEPEINIEEGKALADSYNIPFVETSAKDDIGVTDSFLSIATLMKNALDLKTHKNSIHSSQGGIRLITPRQSKADETRHFLPDDCSGKPCCQ